MRSHRLLTLGAIALAAAGAASCGGNDSESRPGGGTLVVDKSFDLKTVDPARTYEPTGLLLTRPMYDTLLTFRDGDVTQPQPLVAESFETSEDARTHTFRLRDDVKFSDGTPLTAKDVVFSLNRVKNVKGSPSFLLDGVTISSPDERTVVLRTETPNASLPAIVTNPALGIVNSKVVQANGGDASPGAAKKDRAERFLNRQSAGSGPYVLDRYNVATQTSLRANKSYWGSTKPAFERIVVRNVQAPTQKLNVQRGDSQLALDLSGDQVRGLERNLQVETTPSPNVIFLFANANPKISSLTSKPAFREAVRNAIDYDAFVELGGQGAQRAAGIIPSMLLGALDASEAVSHDLEAARRAAQQAGAEGQTPTLEYPTELTVNGLNFAPLAERIQANLAEAGIRIKLQPTAVATALDRYRAGKEELGLWYWGPDYPDPGNYLAFAPGQLVGLRAGWPEGADAAIERLAERASQTVGDARAPIFEDFQRRLNASSPFFPLMQPPSNLVAAKDLSGLVFNPSWTVDLASLRRGA